MNESNSLIDAIINDDIAAVDAAICAGVDVNAFPPGGFQPALHVAIEHQRVGIVRRLLAAGAFVNRELIMPGWDPVVGWTPLVHAIDIESDTAWQAHHETGHESIVITELLLSSGAIPTMESFEIAKQYGNQKALSLLRKYQNDGEVRIEIATL